MCFATRLRSGVIATACLGSLLFVWTAGSRADSFSDQFEDGVIDSSKWTVGGSNQLGFNGYWTWSHQEKIVPGGDGYLQTELSGPSSGITYGGIAWVRTNYNYNDGSNYLINFRWGAEISDWHIDGFQISITDGSDPTLIANWYNVEAYTYPGNPPSGHLWHVDDAKNTRLYWTISGGVMPDPAHAQGQTNMAPTDWSISIDAAQHTASLYAGPNLTGNLISKKSLDPNAPWNVRFLQTDGSSAGFPDGDNKLNLYSYDSQNLGSAVPLPSAAWATVALLGIVAVGRRRLRNSSISA